MGALVFANSYTALGVVRSLGRRGIPVWVLGAKTSLAAVSRYAQRAIPLEGGDESEQIEFLVRLARQHNLNGWVLFPDGDRNVSLLARHHEVLSEHYTMTVPPWEIAQWALEKALTYQLTEELGIAYPRTFRPESLADVESIDGSFPMILKPLNHEGTDRFSIINGAWQADDREQLLKLYGEANDAVAGKPVIAIQEMVPGLRESHFSYATLCRDGQVIASVSAMRRRLLPVDFGSSAYAITTEPVSEVVEPARRWLARVGYTGLADFDFKQHAGTGAYQMLDVNVRPWGWHPLATYAGVDFPYLMWRLALGYEASSGPHEVGVKWIRTPYDLMSAIQLIRRGALTRAEYFGSLRGAHHEMYELDDLVPAIFEVPILLRLLWNKLRGR